MLPSILGPIFCGEEKTSWELHIIVKACVEQKYKEVKQIVSHILEWLIWRCVKERNKKTSAAETDMSVVALPSKN